MIEVEFPALDAINSANKAELQSLARKGGYKVSGTKEELKERLRRGIHGRIDHQKAVSQFSKSSQRTEYHKRPPGELLSFGQENAHLVANLMGMGEGTKKNILRELSDLNSQRNTAQLVACYEDPSLQINKSICRWCGYHARCNEKENNFFRKHINFKTKFEGVSYDGIDFDAETIQSFISQNELLVKYAEDDVNQPFSDADDPFGPFFGRGYSRELHIVPSSTIVLTSNKQNSVQWPHAFFSKYMNRTLTVFEAMIINIATKANSLKITESAADEFPTLQEVSEFFLSLEVTEQNLFTLGLDLTTEGGKLVYDMISNSKRWYEAGLYFGPVELFSHMNEKAPFLPALKKFLTEVKLALKRTIDSKIHDAEAHNLFIQDRNDVIILSPEPVGSEYLLLPQYRPVREIVVKELIKPWCIVDGDIHTRNKGLMIFPQDNNDSITHPDYSKLASTLTEFVHHPMNFRFNLWNHHKEEPIHKLEHGKRPVVTVYPPNDILAAYSSHAIFVNQKLTQNNRYFYKQREDFEIFIERMYFSRLDNRKVVDQLRDEHRHLRKSLNAPRSRRLTPYNRLIGLSKVAPNLIHYSDRDPDGTDDAKDQITEEFSINFNYTKAEEENFTTIIIRRVSKGEDERKLSSATWSIVEQTGVPFVGQRRLLKKFMEQMNPNDQPGQKSSKVLGLYLSKSLLFEIEEERKAPVKSPFSRKLGSIINSYSNSGVVCLSSREEYQAIQHNLGPVQLRHHKSINRNGKEIQFLSWNPPQIAGSSSRLVFFVGTNS